MDNLERHNALNADLARLNAQQIQDSSTPKWANAWTPELVKQWLEHSPHEPGPVAAGLRGWCVGFNFFCSRCCGRLAARGILLPREASPVWADRNPEFAVCAACGNPAPVEGGAK